jgi:cytochrome b pre-mRNA-processing protein 3
LLSTPPLGASAAVSWLLRRNPARQAAELAYGRVVEHSRHPLFFSDCGIPDTLDGRFELICLHVFLYLHRLRRERPRGEAVGQCFVDAMFSDMDRSLREIGTGDLSVGRQVKRMAQALYGRIKAYEQGLGGDDPLLSAVLARNLFGTVPHPAPFLDAMTAYLRRESAQLRDYPTDEILAGRVSFGRPITGESGEAEGLRPAMGGSR